MGVPDSFWLPISYNAAYAAMGDGVAVPVVSWLARHLLTPLADKCSESELAGERIRTDGVPDELMATLRQTTEAAALRWELAHG